jgi:hypothetical protein
MHRLIGEYHAGESALGAAAERNLLALVEAQDREMTVAQSRKEVAERFGVSESQVRTIEREGLDKCWHPL